MPDFWIQVGGGYDLCSDVLREQKSKNTSSPPPVFQNEENFDTISFVLRAFLISSKKIDQGRKLSRWVENLAGWLNI